MFWPRSPRIASRASSLSGRSSTSRMLTRSSARAGVPRVSPTGSAVTCTSGGPLISSHLAVEALGELLVMRFVWSEPRRFLQAQPGPVVGGLVPAGEAVPPAGVDVMPGVLAHGRKGQLAALGLPQDGVVDVGGVQPAAIVEPFLPEKDRDRVHLLARGAARVP